MRALMNGTVVWFEGQGHRFVYAQATAATSLRCFACFAFEHFVVSSTACSKPCSRLYDVGEGGLKNVCCRNGEEEGPRVDT